MRADIAQRQSEASSQAPNPIHLIFLSSIFLSINLGHGTIDQFSFVSVGLVPVYFDRDVAKRWMTEKLMTEK